MGTDPSEGRGLGIRTGAEEINTTPDGTQYLPPEGLLGEDASENSPEKIRKGVFVAFIVALIIAIVLFLSGGASSVGAEVCLIFFVALFVVVIVFVRYFLWAELESPAYDEHAQENEPVREVVRVETVHETVKVRCRYCGTLNLVTDTRCQSCGATL